MTLVTDDINLNEIWFQDVSESENVETLVNYINIDSKVTVK